MGFIYRRWIWLRRFRYRCGYGVHSPFAFDFLTGVVYERGEYYAYRELEAGRRLSFFRRGSHELKCRRFLFRLANYVHPVTIRLYGGLSRGETEYLTKGCSSAAVVKGGRNERAADACGTVPIGKELLVAGRDMNPEEWCKVALRLSVDGSVGLFPDIRVSEDAFHAWEKVKRLPQATVSFDLYDYGIVFYDRSKQRQDYMVNF